jgi:hypothetical protein
MPCHESGAGPGQAAKGARTGAEMPGRREAGGKGPAGEAARFPAAGNRLRGPAPRGRLMAELSLMPGSDLREMIYPARGKIQRPRSGGPRAFPGCRPLAPQAALALLAGRPGFRAPVTGEAAAFKGAALSRGRGSLAGPGAGRRQRAGEARSGPKRPLPGRPGLRLRRQADGDPPAPGAGTKSWRRRPGASEACSWQPQYA